MVTQGLLRRKQAQARGAKAKVQELVSIVEGLQRDFQSVSGTPNSLALAGSDITFLRLGGVGYGMPRARGAQDVGSFGLFE